MMEWSTLISSARFGDKKHQSADHSRSRFEQDYDRIVFSQPFRKLQDKTQVFPLPEDDFVHTRLTHSLEVSSVGRSLGKLAGTYILSNYPGLESSMDIHTFGHIVAAACLAHDLGNPPFGHSGESGISAYFEEKGTSFASDVSKEEWTDLCQFEGNAQGFRILNSSLYKGLELTYATLGAFTKYPLSSSAPKNPDRTSHKKFGFYQSEKPVFQALADEMGMHSLQADTWTRHPLAFLVEAADDICYSIIDLEDACRLGLVSFDEVKQLVAPIIGEAFSEEKLERVASMDEKLGILRAMSIHQLVLQSADVFTSHESELLAGTFDRPLTKEISSASHLGQIAKLSVKKIYRSKPVLEREAGGFEVIARLMEAFCEAGHANRFGKATARQLSIYRLIPEPYQLAIEASTDTYHVLRLITDYIGSLTDRYAIKLYRIVFGL